MKVVYDNDSYIEHHGVKGMKWGQRREKNRAAVNQALKGKNLILTSREARKIQKGTLSLKKAKSSKWQQSHVQSKNYDTNRVHNDLVFHKPKFVQKVNKRISKGQSYQKAFGRTKLSSVVKGGVELGAALALMTRGNAIKVRALHGVSKLARGAGRVAGAIATKLAR